MSQQISLLEDIVNIIIAVLVAFVVYKLSVLIDTLNSKIKENKTSSRRDT